jgi:hypothetical protein
VITGREILYICEGCGDSHQQCGLYIPSIAGIATNGTISAVIIRITSSRRSRLVCLLKLVIFELPYLCAALCTANLSTAKSVFVFHAAILGTARPPFISSG